MKYIYGPLKSRRLGSSLGITLTPYKICSFDCVYCQLGRTTEKTVERKEYFVTGEILSELRAWFQNNATEAKSLDYITFSGSGEPSLHSHLGQLITEIKKTFNKPVVVITNASLISEAAVRQELLPADLVIPSLDAVSEEVFKKIDRPCESIKVENIIEGLIKLRQEFQGKIWLEVMLVKGINDSAEHIRKLKEILERIDPDKIQLNSPVRSTAEVDILPLDKNKLEKIKETLGDKCEIV